MFEPLAMGGLLLHNVEVSTEPDQLHLFFNDNIPLALLQVKKNKPLAAE